MEPVRIGVLGCADIARRRMLPAMTACRTSTSSRSPAGGKRRRPKPRAVSDAGPCTVTRRFSNAADIDAVYVPLPAALHARWARAALDAGKHVLAEKPLTTDPGLTEELVALARSTGLVLMENVMFVHHSQHAAVRRLVADGAIGELRAVHAAFAVPRLPAHDIRHRPELGGGALLDTGVYPLRAALHHLGEDLRVVGATLTSAAGHAVDTAGTALLTTPEGVAAQLSFGIDHAYRSAYEIWGSEGRITVDRAFTPPAGHVPGVRLERRAGTEQVRLAPDDQVLRTVEAFAGAVRTGADAAGVSVRQAVLLDEVRRLAMRY